MRVPKRGDQGPWEGSPLAWAAGVGHDSGEDLHGPVSVSCPIPADSWSLTPTFGGVRAVWGILTMWTSESFIVQ